MKLTINVFIMIFLLSTTAFGVAITKEGSADFSAGSFSDTLVSGDAVVLAVTAEEQWTAGGLKLNSLTTGGRTGVTIDSDGSGGLWVFWEDNHLGEALTEIYGAHVSSSGTVTEKSLTSGTKDIEQPEVVKSINNNAVDGALLICQQKTDKALVVAKYDTSAVTQWGGSVGPLSQTPANPRVASDHSGGAVFVWQDWTDVASGPAIMAQRFDNTGSIPGGTSWLTNGITICAGTVDASSVYPKTPMITTMKSAADEGYIITWYDTREGYQDIYASRVDDNGDVDTGDFSTNGIKISSSGVYKNERKQASALTNNGALTIFAQ